jgi:hypothetical protein
MSRIAERFPLLTLPVKLAAATVGLLNLVNPFSAVPELRRYLRLRRM